MPTSEHEYDSTRETSEVAAGMQLMARLFPLGDDSLEALTRSLPAEALRPTSARYPVAVGDAVFPEVLEEGDAASGFWVSAEARFTKKELQDVSHFEVVCRKFLPESAGDFEWNLAACERASWIKAGGESPIRLASGFAMGRIALKPNMAGAIGDWTAEYVIGSAVVQAFERAGLSGWSLKPVMNPKAQSPHPDFFQIFSDAVLNPATIDCSVERIRSNHPEENGRLRHLGCLSYKASDLMDRPDFCRTAEPWCGWHGWPSWVVSSRAASIFSRNKLRGWAFRPVLSTEGDLYSQYLRQWQLLRNAVAKSVRSKFDGGRW